MANDSDVIIDSECHIRKEKTSVFSLGRPSASPSAVVLTTNAIFFICFRHTRLSV